MKKLLFPFLLAISLALGSDAREANGKVIFRIVDSDKTHALLEPVLPVKLSAIVVKGENPSTATVACTLVAEMDAQGNFLRNIIKCDSAEYEIKQIVFTFDGN